jgi:hypothetical protein
MRHAGSFGRLSSRGERATVEQVSFLRRRALRLVRFGGKVVLASSPLRATDMVTWQKRCRQPLNFGSCLMRSLIASSAISFATFGLFVAAPAHSEILYARQMGMP